MQICATPLINLRAAAAVAATVLGLGAGMAPAQDAAPGAASASVSVRPDQARALAAQMLRDGRPRMAAEIALGLIQRDGGDAAAHYLLARAYQQLHHPQVARREAVRAYHNAHSSAARFHSAQLAATLAYETNRPGLAQLWLRRSWNHAPSDQERRILMRDYNVLRALNPWQVQLRMSVQPSDNVNNGAEDPYAVIDGVPLVGILSADALALSGTKMTGDLSLSYRFRQTPRSQTRVTGRLYLSRVALSDKARDQAPLARNGDYAYSMAELGLQHIHALGEGRGQMRYEAAISHSWYAGSDYQDSLRLGVARHMPLGSAQNLMLAADLTHARPANGAPQVNRLELRGQVTRRLGNGGVLRYGLSGDLADSKTRNHRRGRLSGFVAYALPQKLGPARVSLSLGGAVGHYPDYAVGLLAVPGGREDRMVFGSADFIFESLDYAGFVPSLKIQAQKTRSNVSRFETREMSVSLGIVSRF